MKLNNREKEYEQKLKEEEERRAAVEKIKTELEQQCVLMEENRLKREQEEQKKRELEGKIRVNQVSRLKTLESELHKRDKNFDEKMAQEQKEWHDKTEKAIQELEE